MFRTIIIGILLCFSNMLYTQDLTNIKNSKPLKVTGGMYTNQSVYAVEGMPSRLDPFSWSIGGNVNFSIYEVLDIPFSFSYSMGNRTFNQPSFNQFGASPKYKFLTAHIGYRSMQLSNYSLSGVMFLGGGIEIAPQNSIVKFSAMYGKFAKAVPYDSTKKTQLYANNLFGSPGFERWGWGSKITIGNEQQNIGFVIFKAWDDEHSITAPPLSTGIRPKENLVVGVEGSALLLEKIKIKGEYTLSAFTLDTRSERQPMESFSYVNNLGNLYKPRVSSTNNAAYALSVGYSEDIWTGEISYKRVDPGYESLGTTYLTNDIEDYLVRISRPFLKKRLSISVNAGIQRNNLSNQLLTDNKRFISGLDASFSATENLSFTMNYSNFNSTTAPALITVVDTFKFVQITDNYSISSTYSFGNDNRKHSIVTSFIYQTVNTLNRSATLVTENGTLLYNGNISYTIMFVPIFLNLTTSINYNDYILDKNISSKSIGPAFCASKSVFKNKVKLSYTYSVLNTITSNANTGLMHTMRLGANYRIGKHHSFQLSFNYLNRLAPTKALNKQTRIHEFRGNFSYNFTF